MSVVSVLKPAAMFKFHHLICTLCALLSLSAKAMEAENSNVILMFGDSITYGIPIVPRSFRDPDDGRGENFGPSVLELERLLDDNRQDSLVLNWGLGGSNTQQGLSKINSNIDTSKAAHEADKYFILIQYGTNDEGWGLSTDATRQNLTAMIGAARAKNVFPVLANLTPRSDENVTPRNTIIAGIASDTSTPLVDHHSTFTSFSTYFVLEPKFTNPNEMIYLHPNQMGYDKIANNWFNQVLQGLIEPNPKPLVIMPILGLLLDE